MRLLRLPVRFWITLTGSIGIMFLASCFWARTTLSGRAVKVNLFSLVGRADSSAANIFILVLVILLIISFAAIVYLLVSWVLKWPRPLKLLAWLGFGLPSVVSLAFIIFSASTVNPDLNLTVFPALMAGVSLVTAVFAAEKLELAIRRDWQLYILLLPAVALVFIFSYLPLYGIQIVFKNFRAAFGIAGSEWIGLKHFADFFDSYYSSRLIWNTLLLNIYGLLWAFPVPIIMAIFLNQMKWRRFKRFTQTAIYAPHFISPVVMVGMLFLFLSPTTGLVNRLIEWLGGSSIGFMTDASWFRTIFITTEVWQHAGWNTILYIAALTAINPELYEAATIDGAGNMQKIRYIDIPHLVPIIVLLLILNCGAMLTSNTDKALLMQTPPNIPASDIIGVYVYRMGIQNGQFSYTAAINLFVNVINFALIVSVNWISKRLNQSSLF